jgi:hypothetical protein
MVHSWDDIRTCEISEVAAHGQRARFWPGETPVCRAWRLAYPLTGTCDARHYTTSWHRVQTCHLQRAIRMNCWRPTPVVKFAIYCHSTRCAKRSTEQRHAIHRLAPDQLPSVALNAMYVMTLALAVALRVTHPATTGCALTTNSRHEEARRSIAAWEFLGRLCCYGSR